MTQFKDETGNKYGKLLVLKTIRPNGAYKRSRVVCLCDCGNQTEAQAAAVVSGHTTSCGCAQGRLFKKTHGMRRTPTYNIWTHMKKRCGCETSVDYKHYGARGIKVCDRWQDFSAFYEDMGECPEGYSIERIDVNGDYEPGNCKWVLKIEQPRNTRRTRYAILNGERMIFSDVARALGVSTAMPTNWAKGKCRIPDHLDLVFE